MVAGVLNKGNKMLNNKKTLLLFVFIYLFLFALNYLYPLSFGDDYVFSFVWQGHSMEVPLTEGAVRITSWSDLFVSQCSHYITWGGRFVGITLAQLFLWLGKDVFNVLNAFISVLLIAEICWISNKGEVNLIFDKRMVCVIFFALWFFTVGFNDVFLWLTGASVYLWTQVFLLGFLLPYIKKYYAFHHNVRTGYLFDVGMFFWGVIAGCGNENCICWIILLLFLFLLSFKRYRCNEVWMYTGIIGLMLGYTFLMIAPGNMVRLASEYGSAWLCFDKLKDNMCIFAIVLIFQLFLWHFSLRSLYKIRKSGLKNYKLKKDILLVKLLCAVSFGMSAMMIFSPSFQLRSGFPGTIQLVIAVSILLRVQKEFNVQLIPARTGKFLLGVSSILFVMTASLTIQQFFEMDLQMNNFIISVKQAKKVSSNTVLTAGPFKYPDSLKNLLSGYHLSYFRLSDDVNSWGNVAFARYYGIRGIRMVKVNDP